MTGPAIRRMLRGTLATALLAGTLTLTVGTLTAAADPSVTSWAKLRNCESGGNYRIVSVNGHYGAYQFDLATWRSVGGSGRPNQASPAEQDYRALYLYRMRGWQPWACAHIVGLRPDRDARSKRVPTRAEAAYIGGHPAPVTTVGSHQPATPPWPGLVYAYGDCAPALRTWQLRMNAYGYHFDGTGCYYTETRTAVLALQRANHIKASGRLGPQTWKAAWHGTSPRHPTTQAATPPWPGLVYAYGDCARPLRTWQLRMNAYGYHFDGTGCYYTKTRTAVLALQRANHIKASGRLGPQTWKAAWHGTRP